MSKKTPTFDLSALPNDKSTLALCELVAQSLDDMKATNITFINVKDISSVTDVMIIASGSSNRHVKSIAENVVAESKKNNHQILGSEGQEASEWVLVDLGDILVHVMQEQARSFYELEKLWTDRQDDGSDDLDEDDLLGREFDED